MIGGMFDVVRPLTSCKPAREARRDEGKVNHRRLVISRPGRFAFFGRQFEAIYRGNFEQLFGIVVGSGPQASPHRVVCVHITQNYVFAQRAFR